MRLLDGIRYKNQVIYKIDDIIDIAQGCFYSVVFCIFKHKQYIVKYTKQCTPKLSKVGLVLTVLKSVCVCVLNGRMISLSIRWD